MPNYPFTMKETVKLVKVMYLESNRTGIKLKSLRSFFWFIRTMQIRILKHFRLDNVVNFRASCIYYFLHILTFSSIPSFFNHRNYSVSTFVTYNFYSSFLLNFPLQMVIFQIHLCAWNSAILLGFLPYTISCFLLIIIFVCRYNVSGQ